MDSLEGQLFDAAHKGDAAGVRACLAAGADINFRFSGGLVPLHVATHYGHTECVAALIAGGAEANITNNGGEGPLLYAAWQNWLGCVQLLLAVGADPLAAMPATGWTPLHYAAGVAYTDMALLLLQAEPAAALVKDREGNTPLTLAIHLAHHDIALCLLEQGPLPPAREVLAALVSTGGWAMPLYATLVSRQPLTAEEWGMLPPACTCLGTALPTVLARSASEAAQLVRHLPAADQQSLRTAALCLALAQWLANAALPTPLVWRILGQTLLLPEQ